MFCIGVGPPVRAAPREGEIFVKAIEAIRESGGGDCAEKAFSGIIEALNAGVEANSPLYVFTDATAKDEYKREMAKQAVMGKGASVYFFTTELCGKDSYEPFENLALESCGQMFELPEGSKDLYVAKMLEITKGFLSAKSCDHSGMGGGGVFGRKKRSGGSEYKLPFDDIIEKVIVSVTTQNTNATIDLNNPLGDPVSSGKTTLVKGAIFEIDHPMPGK